MTENENLRFWESRLEEKFKEVEIDLERDSLIFHESEREYFILLCRVEFENYGLSEKWTNKYEDLVRRY